MIDDEDICKGESEVKLLREFLELSQDGFARLVGVTTGTVSKWEQNVNNPRFSFRQYLVIAKALREKGSDLEDFLETWLKVCD